MNGRANMASFLFFVFLLFETLINPGRGQDYDKKTEQLIAEQYPTPNYLIKYPEGDGFISRSNLFIPESVWGCDKYSAAIYVVTKRAITFAKDVTRFLQYSMNSSEESSKISSSPLVELKINVLNKGVDLYRDLSSVVQVLWQDSKNAVSILAEELSNELELQISRLPH